MKFNVHIDVDTDRLKPSEIMDMRCDVAVVLNELDSCFLKRIGEIVDRADQLEAGLAGKHPSSLDKKGVQ